MKNQWRVMVGLVLVLIVVIFAVLNNQTVPVSFGFAKISGPLILIILGSAIIGALIGLLTSTTTMWKQKRQVKELKKEAETYIAAADEQAAETEKVKRELADLQSKYASQTTMEQFQEAESVGSRVDHFTKPRNDEEI